MKRFLTSVFGNSKIDSVANEILSIFRTKNFNNCARVHVNRHQTRRITRRNEERRKKTHTAIELKGKLRIQEERKVKAPFID